MVRLVHTAFVVLIIATAIVAVVACRDMDDPPPVPVFDPNAPADGGADATAEGGLAGLSIHLYAHSFAL